MTIPYEILRNVLGASLTSQKSRTLTRQNNLSPHNGHFDCMNEVQLSQKSINEKWSDLTPLARIVDME